jgi:hypothetical protein
MSTETLTAVQTSSNTSRAVLALAALGWKEGRRILLSPVLLVVFGYTFLMGGIVQTVTELGSSGVPTKERMYELLVFFGALYAGLLFYMASHLVASSSRRTHADRQLAASTMSSRVRSAGTCWGVVVGPGLFVALLMGVTAWLGSSLVMVEGQPPWSAVGLLEIVLTVVGGGLFGVMVATWLRFPGSLPVGLVVLVFGTVAIGDPDGPLGRTLPWFAPYISEPSWTDNPWTQQGSQGWHAVYLIGLCALAVCATMLRQREGRLRWIGISSIVLLLTAAAGWIQLP